MWITMFVYMCSWYVLKCIICARPSLWSQLNNHVCLYMFTMCTKMYHFSTNENMYVNIFLLFLCYRIAVCYSSRFCTPVGRLRHSSSYHWITFLNTNLRRYAPWWLILFFCVDLMGLIMLAVASDSIITGTLNVCIYSPKISCYWRFYYEHWNTDWWLYRSSLLVWIGV